MLRRVLTVAVAAVVLLASVAAAAAFTDIGGNVHRGDIEALAAAGVTRGCNPPADDLYCPDRAVTRGEMAAFLVRALELPKAGAASFSDTAGSVFAADIAALAGAGITRGCNPPANDRFCPEQRVTRGQMAAFLARALELPPAATTPFTDTTGSVFAADIAALARADITRGCNPPANDRFCPGDPVRRDQMASFLVRALDLPPVTGPACERWVATTGSDSAAGSQSAPWRTIEHAVEAVPATGCVITVMPGTYDGAEIERRFEFVTTIRSATPYRAVLASSSTVLAVDGANNVTIEGFEIRQSGTSGNGVLVNVEDGNGHQATNIALRNNIVHDAYDNDLLKIRSGARWITVEGNVFYNPASNEQHMDVNGVSDVVITDNVFFNDYAGSGRPNPGDTKAYIVVKDSSGTGDLGSRRITIRRNVFMNWQGGNEPFLQVGNDGKAYHEAIGVRIENNLLLGNSPIEANAAVGIAGVRDVMFVNNTVTGDLPASQYLGRIVRKGSNPANQGIVFANNIYSDPTGTFGELTGGDDDPGDVTLTNNLYWNDGNAFESSDPLSVTDDPDRVVGNPALEENHTGTALPRWTGSGFPSGTSTVRQEFIRLVERYAAIGPASAAIDRADPALAPSSDILKRTRGGAPDLGAWER